LTKAHVDRALAMPRTDLPAVVQLVLASLMSSPVNRIKVVLRLNHGR